MLSSFYIFYKNYQIKYKILFFTGGLILHSTFHYLPAILFKKIADSVLIFNYILLYIAVPITTIILSIFIRDRNPMGLLIIFSIIWGACFILLSSIVSDKDKNNSFFDLKNIFILLTMHILETCRSMVLPLLNRYITRRIHKNISKQTIGITLAGIFCIVMGEKLLKVNNVMSFTKMKTFVAIIGLVVAQIFTIFLKDKKRPVAQILGQNTVYNRFIMYDRIYMIFITINFILGVGRELILAQLIHYQINVLELASVNVGILSKRKNVKKIIGPFGFMRSFCMISEILCILYCNSFLKFLKRVYTNLLSRNERRIVLRNNERRIVLRDNNIPVDRYSSAIYLYGLSFAPLVLFYIIYICISNAEKYYYIFCIAEFLRGISNALSSGYAPLVVDDMIEDRSYKLLGLYLFNATFYGINVSVSNLIILGCIKGKGMCISTFKNVFKIGIIVLSVGIIMLGWFLFYYRLYKKRKSYS